MLIRSTWVPVVSVLWLLATSDRHEGLEGPRRDPGAEDAAGAGVSPLTIDGSQFRFRGAPLTIISGEMHYARVPREYWRDRLLKARAMGLNTVSTYVFWNLHEPTPGRYDFSGQNDVAAYIRTAGEVGLHVIVRPGPYVCAEWELGGYPAWLLANPDIVLRSTDPAFTAPAARWLDRLGRELAPLFADRGGPIIATQVENEYGSFGDDKTYLAWQRDALVHAGFGHALLYTADGPGQLPKGTLPELPAVVNFGPGGAAGAFNRLSAFRPGAPLMSGEYWAGWFDQWGQRHHTTNASQQATELGWMLERGSVNLYMFHGGTTFGWMNGANIDGGAYHPQTSSYDYDSALDESGRPTPKYFQFRDAIARRVGEPLPPVPLTPEAISPPPITLDRTASLWSTLGSRVHPVHVDQPRSMETFGQAYGDILYRTRLSGPAAGDLVIEDVRDYVQVYLDRALVGTLDRRLNQDRLAITVPAGGADLDLLVENSGRVNFSLPLRAERKGITKRVRLGDRELKDWDVYCLPMASMPTPDWVPTRAITTKGTKGHEEDWGSSAITTKGTKGHEEDLGSRAITTKDTKGHEEDLGLLDGPGFYRGTFTLTATGDTFFDMRGWGKGVVWINGHALGRYWSIGPTETLYVPGPWLHRGSNEVVIFDLVAPAKRTLATVARPLLDDAK
jgi:beta-galactosidase